MHAYLFIPPNTFFGPHAVVAFALMKSSLARRCQTVFFQGRGLTPDIRGGLPLKMVSTSFDFDQEQFDAAREKMKACPPMEASRLGFKGAAGTSSTPATAN